MRQHFYNFAHRVLPHDVLTEPTLWNLDLERQGGVVPRGPVAGARRGCRRPAFEGADAIGQVEVFATTMPTVRMPPPEHPAEAYTRRSRDVLGNGDVRYFVCEQGASRVFMAEWRAAMPEGAGSPGGSLVQIRGGDLDERVPLETLDSLTSTPSRAAHGEVATTAIPGMPYLASFLVAVVAEMGNADANAVAKQRPAASTSAPTAGRGTWPPGLGLRIAVGAIAIVVLAVLAMIVAWKLLP